MQSGEEKRLGRDEKRLGRDGGSFWAGDWLQGHQESPEAAGIVHCNILRIRGSGLQKCQRSEAATSPSLNSRSLRPYPSNKAMQCYTYAVFLSPPWGINQWQSTWALMVQSTGSFLSTHISESAAHRCFRSECKWLRLKDTLGAAVLPARASKPLGQSLILALLPWSARSRNPALPSAHMGVPKTPPHVFPYCSNKGTASQNDRWPTD